MSNRIAAIRSGLILLFTTTAMAGCGIDGITAHNSPAGRTDGADLRLEPHGMIEREALRIRKDTLRNRLWVLTLDEVRVYDTAKNRKRLIRKIDVANADASMIRLDNNPPLDACAFTTQLLNDIERSRQP